MFSNKKQIIRECPKCSLSDYWDGAKCISCGYIHKLAAKDENTSKLIRALFQPSLYDPHRIFIGSERVPQSPGLYGWFFGKSLVNMLKKIKSDSYFIEPDGTSEPEKDWFLLYIGIAGKKKGRTLQDRIHGEHLNQNSKGSTLRQSLAALLWEIIRLDPRKQLNGLDEKAKLNLWMFENARVTWLNVEKPQKIEKIVLKEFGEYLPFNLQENKANPYRKEFMRLRKVWRKGGQ